MLFQKVYFPRNLSGKCCAHKIQLYIGFNLTPYELHADAFFLECEKKNANVKFLSRNKINVTWSTHEGKFNSTYLLNSTW